METTQNKRKLAERLKKIRDHYGWSARELAEKIGLGMSTVQSYERGMYYPKAETLQKISDLTGFSVAFITGIEDYFGDNAPIKDTRFESYFELKIVRDLHPAKSLDMLTSLTNTERIIKVAITEKTKDKEVFGLIPPSPLSAYPQTYCPLSVNRVSRFSVYRYGSNPNKAKCSRSLRCAS